MQSNSESLEIFTNLNYLSNCPVLVVQEGSALYGEGGHRFAARPEMDNTFWTDGTLARVFVDVPNNE